MVDLLFGIACHLESNGADLWAFVAAKLEDGVLYTRVVAEI